MLLEGAVECVSEVTRQRSPSSHRSDARNPPCRGQVSVREQKDPKAQTSAFAKAEKPTSLNGHVNVSMWCQWGDKRLVWAADEGQVAWKPGYRSMVLEVAKPTVTLCDSQQSLLCEVARRRREYHRDWTGHDTHRLVGYAKKWAVRACPEAFPECSLNDTGCLRTSARQVRSS